MANKLANWISIVSFSPAHTWSHLHQKVKRKTKTSMGCLEKLMLMFMLRKWFWFYLTFLLFFCWRKKMPKTSKIYPRILNTNVWRIWLKQIILRNRNKVKSVKRFLHSSLVIYSWYFYSKIFLKQCTTVKSTSLNN